MTATRPLGYPATVTQVRRNIKDFGTCLKFTGNGEQITVGTTNVFDNDFYFATWVRWYGTNGTFQHLFSKRDSYGASTMMFDFYISPTGKLSLDTNVAQKDFGSFLPVNRMAYVVWVHNKTDGYEQLYINGEKVSEVSIASLGTGTTALNAIGGTQSPVTESFNGIMDEIVIGTTNPQWPDVIAMYAKYTYPSQWAYFKLDEGSGSSTTDSSGNGNTGTIIAATYTTDKVMTTRSVVGVLPALQFINGSTNSMSIGNSAIMQGLTALTIEGWLRVDATLSFSPKILEYLNGNTGFHLQLSNGNRIAFQIGNGTTTGTVTSPSSAAAVLPLNTYVYVAAVWDGGRVNIFVNGIGTSSVALAGGNTGNPGKNLVIGNSAVGGSGGNGPVSASFSSWRISNIARFSPGVSAVTPAPIKIPRGPLLADANTLALWRFLDNTGKTAVDISGNGLHGALAGSILPVWTTGYFNRLIATGRTTI